MAVIEIFRNHLEYIRIDRYSFKQKQLGCCDVFRNILESII